DADLAVQREVLERRRHRRRVVARRVRNADGAALAVAFGRLVPLARELVPREVRAVRAARKLGRADTFAGRDLEHVAIAIAVVADHVEDERTYDVDLRDVARGAVLGGEREPALDQRLAEGARAQAVGRELLPAEAHQPD